VIQEKGAKLPSFI